MYRKMDRKFFDMFLEMVGALHWLYVTIHNLYKEMTTGNLYRKSLNSWNHFEIHSMYFKLHKWFLNMTTWASNSPNSTFWIGPPEIWNPLVPDLIQMLDSALWVRDPTPWILHLSPWIINSALGIPILSSGLPGFEILLFRFQILLPGFEISLSGFRSYSLDSKFCSLDSASTAWILNYSLWIPRLRPGL